MNSASGDPIPSAANFQQLLPCPDRALVDPLPFLLATRDTGYRSAATAIAELVDNSLQAESRRIRLLLDDDRTCPGGLRIAVLDDGKGMSDGELSVALQFGGSERFGSRSGLGRFGMGLPNSSMSQARRVDVYSWRTAEDVYHSWLDIDEVIAGKRTIPHPRRAVLPPWIPESLTSHGTLVIWTRCDKLAARQASPLAAKLREELGRMYRFALWEGVAIEVNGNAIRPLDPLFLRPSAGLKAKAFGRPLQYEFKSERADSTSVIQVRFSELPVADWQRRSLNERRASGIIGGAGVSVVRAGREIDHGWHLMGGKRRENYDDWWRCEITFEPELDELFGVTHSKQGIRPSPELVALLAPDLEPVARLLNRRVRDTFTATAEQPASLAVRRATRRSHLLPEDTADTSRLTGYRIEARDLTTGDFFQLARADQELHVVLNRRHPFYDRIYRPLADRASTRFGLECVLLAAARALDAGSAQPDAEWVRQLRAKWSDALAAFLT